MTIEQKRQQWLFSAITGWNQESLHIDTVRDGLSHALCSANLAVSGRAAQMLGKVYGNQGPTEVGG